MNVTASGQSKATKRLPLEEEPKEPENLEDSRMSTAAHRALLELKNSLTKDLKELTKKVINLIA